MGCKGAIRGTDWGNQFVGRIPAVHVGLSGAVGGDLGEIGEQRAGMGETFGGRPAARTVSLFPEWDPAVPFICTCHQGREFMDGIWGKIHVQVMYDTLPGLSSIERRGKRGNGTGVPAMYTGHLGEESVRWMGRGHRGVHLRPG